MKIFDMEGYTPSPEELANGELAYNLIDDLLSLKIDSGMVINILKDKDVMAEGVVKLNNGLMIQYGTSTHDSSVEVTNRFGDTSGKTYNTPNTIVKFKSDYKEGETPIVIMNGSAGSLHIRSIPIDNTQFRYIEWTRATAVDAECTWVAFGRWK